MRNCERLSGRTGVDEPGDVKSAEQEDEGVNRAEDHERNRRLGRGQEWRHRIRSSQHAKDNPGLTADFSGEPAGENGNEGQRKAEERQPEQEMIALQPLLETQIGTEPSEPQHYHAASNHDPEAEE